MSNVRFRLGRCWQHEDNEQPERAHALEGLAPTFASHLDHYLPQSSIHQDPESTPA